MTSALPCAVMTTLSYILEPSNNLFSLLNYTSLSLLLTNMATVIKNLH